MMQELNVINLPDHLLPEEPKQPDEHGRQEYVITLHSHEDLDHFYDDMETPGGSLYIPDRAVPVEQRLPSSRNTSYRLTAEEVELIKNDPRVLAVTLTLEEAGLKIVPHWVQTSTAWSKNSSIVSASLNWGLKRCTDGADDGNWGTDGGILVPKVASGTVTTTASGKNVDVIIVDDHLKTAHPEAAVNIDGTGGSRVVEYNWFQHNPTVTGGAVGTYTYSAAPSDNHGANVAGIAAGNTCGWARDANIYCINPYGTSGNSPAPNTNNILNYVKEFHLNKPVNPNTGRKNPTIVNMSIGITPTHAILGTSSSSSGPITSMRYAGTVYNTSTWSANNFAYPSGVTGGALTGTGMFVAQVNGNWGIYFPTRYAPMEADITDLINAGVIVVVAAGNEYSIMENYSGDDADHYNDYIVASGVTYYPRRGGISTVDGCIAVGSIDTTVAPRKSDFSNTGPRVDIFAPGSNIASSSNTSSSGVRDPRNTSYYKILMSGTSMACPQVTGILACLLEAYPDLNQSEALEFLNSTFSKSDQLSQTGNAEQYLGSYYSLAGASNRYLFCQLERKVSGEVYPKQNTRLRPSDGQLWPRSRIKRV
jgi:hypothetical protein